MDPIIIIGAPRSGTKMLRELLKLHPNISGALHEEERVWSYGNLERSSRTLRAEDATPKVKKYIRAHYNQAEKKSGNKLIVAKNVANTLRLEYVREIFPNSPIINIIRDGRDAAYSAKSRWETPPLDFKYLIRNKIFKEKNFPIKEIPYFIIRQIKWVFQSKKHKGKKQQWWGPKLDDYETLLENHDLIELCGIQWLRCVEKSQKDLSRFENNNYLTVTYENLVFEPENTMKQIYNFLEMTFDKETRELTENYVEPTSVGKWQSSKINPEEHNKLLKIIGPMLEKLGYKL